MLVTSNIFPMCFISGLILKSRKAANSASVSEKKRKTEVSLKINSNRCVSVTPNYDKCLRV